MKLPTTINAINELYEKQENGERYHLGCSVIGHKCDRFLWYSFRWAFVEQFDGRMLRLFKDGHDFEPVITKDLRAIGVDIRSSQENVNFDAHVSGSVDGIIYSGLPESPNKKHVVEFKTHSEKSFKQLAALGVEKAKPLHYTQMQTYMLGLKIDRAFYLAKNKNNAELYTERVRLDRDFAEKAVNRAKRITLLDRKPEPMTSDPTWFECTYCAAKSMCHKNEPTKESNCRTCAHSTPLHNNTWHCAKWDSEIPNKAQKAGCEFHVIHPDLVPYQMKPAHDEWHAIYIVNNKEVLNGKDGFKSSEILANPNECANPSEFVQQLRENMNARIVKNEGEN